MKRPWQVWTAFIVCLSVVLIVMAWGTHVVRDLERTNNDIQSLALQEQTLRLALWRMDSAITPLIIEESARPYVDYNAFNPAAVARSGEEKPAPQQKMQPSSLLGNKQASVNLYFNTVLDEEADGQQIISPQVPNQPNKEAQTWLANNGPIQVQIEDNEQKLNTFRSNIKASDLLTNWSGIATTSEIKGRQSSKQQTSTQIENAEPMQQRGIKQSDLEMAQSQQETLNTIEYEFRQKTAKDAQWRIRQSRNDYYDTVNSGDQQSTLIPGKAKADTQWSNKITEESMQILWIDDLLIMGRKVRIDNKDTIQGAWLNWNQIKSELLDDIEDLYPEADLVPVKRGSEAGNESRMMAVLPAMIVPGMSAIAPSRPPSPYSIPLMIGWVCTVFSIAAVGCLLFGAVSLSERRGAFVSAVTHELRTPLTTLRIYTEMLAEGMVHPSKVAEYLNTLNTESKRLGNLVENVLAYAKLERGRGGRTMESTSVTALLDRICPRLIARAEDADMQLIIDIQDQVGAANIFTDVMAVDQILFNLIDNACKYSADANDRRLHLAITCDKDSIFFRVCDHGKGLKANEIRSAFKPFRKSAEKAAHTAPGVGLGLALCRRTTRQLGGSIDYEKHPSYGACFILTLPTS